MGRDALLAQKSAGITKKLIGFRLLERGIARHGFKVLNQAHQIIGEVSSGSWPPGHETAIGFAYILPAEAQIDREILIAIRDRETRAIISKAKFIK